LPFWAITLPLRQLSTKSCGESFFFTLGFTGILLVWIVEKKIDDDHADEVKQQRSAIQQLIASNQTLGSQILHPPLSVEHQQMAETLSAIQGKLNIPSQRTQSRTQRALSLEEQFHVMSDADLKTYTGQLVTRLRNFQAAYQTNEYNYSMQSPPTTAKTQEELKEQYNQLGIQFMNRLVEHERQYKEQFWADVAAVYLELADRIRSHGKMLPEIPGFEPGGVRMTLSTGANADRMRIDDIANFLELLKRAL
jgi:hypothetical protein